MQLPAEGGTVTLEGKVWSIFPLTKVVIHRNGKIWKEIPLAGDSMSASFQELVPVSESGWFSLTAEGAPANPSLDSAYPQAGTNVVRVYVGDQKIRSRESAEYFIRWIDKLRSISNGWPGWRSQAEKDHVFAQFGEARQVFEKLAKEARR